MQPWMYLVIVVAIGLPLLAVAALADRRAREAQRGLLTSVPDRSIPGHQGEDPVYIPSDDILGRPIQLIDPDQEESSEIEDLIAEAEQLPCGWANDRFATHTNPTRTILRQPLVLVVDEIGAMRELLTPLQRARQQGSPLVIVAQRVEEATLDALAANRVRFGLGILVVLADASVRAKICALTTALEVPRVDLQAGYLPPESLPQTSFWIADKEVSWLSKTQPSSQS